MNIRFGMLGVVAAFIVTTPLPAYAQSAPNESEATYIVRYTSSVTARATSGELSRRRIKVSYDLSSVFPGAIAKLRPSEADALRGVAGIASVERDAPVRVAATQSAPSWGLDRIDQRTLPLSGAFSYAATGNGVSAYIVDTGILGTHAEFAGRVRPGYSAVDDGKGTSDCHGHGTHVAGTVGGTTFGVAKRAALIAVRVLDCAGSGSISGVVAGLDWVVRDHAAGAPAVLNMSLGGGASASLDAAVQAVVADGVTVVVAAGNSFVDACTSSPARAPAAITVGATDASDARASFSNFGPCVDVFAPGVSITSAWSTSTAATAVLSGTSMAAPHVAGAVAALLSSSPTLSPTAVASQLSSAATPGVVSDAGPRSPNRLLFSNPDAVTPTPTTTAPPTTTTTKAPTTTTTKAPTTTTTKAPITTTTTVRRTAPQAPAIVNAVVWSSWIVVTWTQGANGGSPLVRQSVLVNENGRYIGAISVPAEYSAVVVSGLTAGKRYTFAVSATNAIGTSPNSTPSNLVTMTRPVLQRR